MHFVGLSVVNWLWTVHGVNNVENNSWYLESEDLLMYFTYWGKSFNKEISAKLVLVHLLV